MEEAFGDLLALSAADQGVGRLRHLDILAHRFGCTYVVDTRRQLFRRQELFGIPGTRVVDVAEYARDGWHGVRVVTDRAFGRTQLGLDVVFSTCVYSVVPSYVRPGLAESAFRNLRPGGLYVVVAQRNDASILARCDAENEYDDGHVFTRYGTSTTFYTNYRSYDRLLAVLVAAGFEVLADRSMYRYVWLFLRRPI